MAFDNVLVCTCVCFILCFSNMCNGLKRDMRQAEKAPTLGKMGVYKNPIVDKVLKQYYGQEKGKSLRISTAARSNKVGTAPSATGFFVSEQYWNGKQLFLMCYL